MRRCWVADTPLVAMMSRFSAKKVYTVCVPAQDGGSFDLSPDAKEVTLSIVLAR